MSNYEDSLHLAELVALMRRLLCVMQQNSSKSGGGSTGAMEAYEAGILSKTDFEQMTLPGNKTVFKYTFKQPFAEKPVLLFKTEDSKGGFVPAVLIESTKDSFTISNVFSSNPNAKVHYVAYTPKANSGGAKVEDSSGNFI